MVTSTMQLTGMIGKADQPVDEYSEIKQVAARDEQAFEALYLRYHPKLTRFVWRMLRDSAQVEEVVSDTLYAVWSGASRFQQKSKVSTWVFGIAFRTATKAARSGSNQARFTEGASNPEYLVDPHNANNPADGAEIQDRAFHLIKALEQLSVEQRAVVELTALGWSCTEIGEILECPSNTVKTRMFNARKKLNHLLNDRALESHSVDKQND